MHSAIFCIVYIIFIAVNVIIDSHLLYSLNTATVDSKANNPLQCHHSSWIKYFFGVINPFWMQQILVLSDFLFWFSRFIGCSLSLLLLCVSFYLATLLKHFQLSQYGNSSISAESCAVGRFVLILNIYRKFSFAPSLFCLFCFLFKKRKLQK